MNASVLNNVASLKPETMRFISSLAANGTSRSMSTSLALGRVIACALPFSTFSNNDQSDRELAFSVKHSIEVNTVIDAINEFVLIDRQAVLEFTRNFWCYRLDMAMLDPIVYNLQEDRKVADFFGYRKHFSDEVINHIATTSASFTTLTNNFKVLVNTITGVPDQA